MPSSLVLRGAIAPYFQVIFRKTYNIYANFLSITPILCIIDVLGPLNNLYNAPPLGHFTRLLASQILQVTKLQELVALPKHSKSLVNFQNTMLLKSACKFSHHCKIVPSAAQNNTGSSLY
jgi:hypothetical protein